jgi:hypothetical protein
LSNGLINEVKNDFSIHNNIIWFDNDLVGAEAATGDEVKSDSCAGAAAKNE